MLATSLHVKKIITLHKRRLFLLTHNPLAGRPVGVGEAGEASASPLFSHRIEYAVQYSSSLTSQVTHIVMYLHAYYTTKLSNL